ncbi:MAG TPA: recombinase family protein [Bacteroidia bacterium]|nr:recombinase family protein [Bacteroidia bacterium]
MKNTDGALGVDRFKSLLPKSAVHIDTNNAIIYTRVSTAEQMETNFSLETQKKHCLEYAIKNNMNVIAEFGGTYESAKTEDRKEFKKMLLFLNANKDKISYLIVYSLDRFSRSGEQAMVLAGKLKKLGVNLVSITQPTDLNSDMGVFYQNLLLLFGKLDNDMRRTKTITGMRERLLSGYFCGKAPIGYVNVPGVPRSESIVMNEKAKWIKKAFEWKLNEQISNVEIAARLQNVGINLTSKRLTIILRNPFYCGILIGNILGDEIVEGKHPPLISKEMFWQVQATLDGTHSGYSVSSGNEKYPLKQFVICDRCNTALTGYMVKKKKLDYYKCNKIGCGCNASVAKLHQGFIDLLSSFIVEKKFHEPLKHMMSNVIRELGKDRVQMRKQYLEALQKIESRIEKIEENFAIGEINSELYTKFSKKYSKEKQEIETQIKEEAMDLSNLEICLEKALKISANLPEMWELEEYKIKKRLQKLVFPEGIRYNKQTNTYRTTKVNSIFSLIPHGKRLLEEQKSGNSNEELPISAFVPGAGIEPARPQWPQDFKYYATLQNATKRDIWEQKKAKGCL